MDESKALFNIIEGKYERFSDYGIPDASDFLTMEEQSRLAGFMRQHAKEGVFFFGGFEEAERRAVVFMPEYTGVTDEKTLREYYLKNPDDCPFAVLEVTVSEHVPAGRRPLSHRDYLGALMGEGIKREKTGDIVTGESGKAQIVIRKELAEYLADNYRQVGPIPVTARVTDISQIDDATFRTETVRIPVPSLRLDNMISAGFDVSRKDACEAISRGRVFASGIEMTKPDYQVKSGEKIVLRGSGKFICLGEDGQSRKGKTYVKIKRFL